MTHPHVRKLEKRIVDVGRELKAIHEGEAAMATGELGGPTISHVEWLSAEAAELREERKRIKETEGKQL